MGRIIWNILLYIRHSSDLGSTISRDDILCIEKCQQKHENLHSGLRIQYTIHRSIHEFQEENVRT